MAEAVTTLSHGNAYSAQDSECPAQSPENVQELTKPDASAAAGFIPASFAPQTAGIIKRTRRTPGEGTWNKYSRDYPQKKLIVQVSKYSKEEASRRKQWEIERKEIRERTLRIQQQRARELAAREREELERMQQERKEWARAKYEQRQEKIRYAAEERRKREKAYFELIEKSREKGLLYERLITDGENKVSMLEKQKLDEYRNGLGRARRVGAAEIQLNHELHPSLKNVQRKQKEENLRREAGKVPLAFSPKYTSNSGGISFVSQLGSQAMPGSAGYSKEAGTLLYTSTKKPNSRSLSPRRSQKQHSQYIDRASSPLSLPGVQIIVSSATQPSPIRHDSGRGALQQSKDISPELSAARQGDESVVQGTSSPALPSTHHDQAELNSVPHPTAEDSSCEAPDFVVKASENSENSPPEQSTAAPVDIVTLSEQGNAADQHSVQEQDPDLSQQDTATHVTHESAVPESSSNQNEQVEVESGNEALPQDTGLHDEQQASEAENVVQSDELVEEGVVQTERDS